MNTVPLAASPNAVEVFEFDDGIVEQTCVVDQAFREGVVGVLDAAVGEL